MINNVIDFVAILNDEFKKAQVAGTVHSEHVFAIESGRKYDKVTVSNPQKSVYCFVDREGNIYKAASWAAPAKGVRWKLADITEDMCAKIASAGYATTGWLYR